MFRRYSEPRQKQTAHGLPRPIPANNAIERACIETLESRRLLSGGNLDATFGAGGITTTDFAGRNDAGRSIALQSDGKLLVAGSKQGSDFRSDFAVARYNADGSPDTTFGAGGKVTKDLAGLNDIATGIAVQADGKIVVGGYGTITSGNDFALVRYNGDGSLDDGSADDSTPGDSFGTGGVVTFDTGTTDTAGGLAIQSDGKIIIVGYSFNSGTSFDFRLVRFNTDGSLDDGSGTDLTPADSFGTSGLVTTDIGGSADSARSIEIQSDGKIVVAGQSNLGAVNGNDFALARYNADGSLDSTFGSGGLVTTSLGGTDDIVWGLAVEPDGQIVAAGYTGTISNFTSHDVALARYNDNGALDAGFGTGGIALTDMGGDDYGFGVAVQSDGNLIVAGRSSSTGGGDIALLSYSSNGTLDGTFGSGGIVTTDIAGSTDEATGLVIQPDGKIVVGGGGVQPTTSFDFAIARYEYTPGAINTAPTVGPVSAPTDPAPVGTVVTVTADYSDPDAGDSLTATWDFGDGTAPVVAPLAGTSGTASIGHSYAEPGVYTVHVVVADSQGETAEASSPYVVVYDPDGGFVTGGGWIDSPAGAYRGDASLSGKATFGFVSKYQKGANVPSGQTQFQFAVGDLRFDSTSYDWMVVNNSKAQFKGSGTINGQGEYAFMISATDSGKNGGADRFRIKIWDKDTDEIIYDNNLGVGHEDAELSGGSIVIHSR